MKYWPFALRTSIIPIRSARIAVAIFTYILGCGGNVRGQQPAPGADTAMIARSSMTAVRVSRAAPSGDSSILSPMLRQGRVIPV